MNNLRNNERGTCSITFNPKQISITNLGELTLFHHILNYFDLFLLLPSFFFRFVLCKISEILFLRSHNYITIKLACLFFSIIPYQFFYIINQICLNCLSPFGSHSMVDFWLWNLVFENLKRSYGFLDIDHIQ